MRLHPEHGLNPTIPICFWCEKPKREIVCLGAKYNKKAPMHMVIDYEPCNECMANMAMGITLVEGEDITRLQRPPLIPGGDLAPTGRWLVVKEEAAARLPIPDDKKQMMLKSRRALIDKEAFELLLESTGETNA